MTDSRSSADVPDPSERRINTVSPMYTQLLEQVLADDADAPARPAGPLAELNRLRHVMEKHAGRNDPGWALQAVADQLAYDAALIRLARKRRIATDINVFEVPEHGRLLLEQALIAKGVHVPSREVVADRTDRTPSGTGPGASAAPTSS